ncbi:MSEP-CTERM sorting domain-containing protein [Pedobacter sandarakinus]|uniref:MSEP-CTERM sorting domain-containing protein n=1 Tax=Pedobacter sandarakinus TaxID=353156 RepID=UPI002246CD2D|nr:MSEP-CTERM sorting domain-containing protein [Pedobacter sandarakinus]MCX2574824.1 MSEP-CTERM sorting domain-containing protein [Pedobacter sandarakinus]
MKTLLNPKWILFINILPSVILIVLFFNQYLLIKNLLPSENTTYWIHFFCYLLSLICLQTIYVIHNLYRYKKIGAIHAGCTLLIYAAFLYYYGYFAEALIPPSIPAWMITVDTFMYPGTFLMPTLFHSLMILVIYSVEKSKSKRAWLSFFYAMAVPLLSYVFVLIILPLWKKTDSNFSFHTIIIAAIILSILFIFFLCRWIYMLSWSNSNRITKYSIYFRILLCIILPIIALGLNNGYFGFSNKIGSAVFGDFSSIWFYIIVILNGVTICTPEFKNAQLRLTKYLILWAGLPYSLYFFLVFAPFIPISVVAIIAFGFGFLLLAPLGVFIIHINLLYKLFNHLKETYHIGKLIATSILCFAIIPTSITLTYFRDKITLNNALEYVYSPDYSKVYDFNNEALSNTLKMIEKAKQRGDGSNSYNQPFLTPYYNWLVLDNMVLSTNKIEKLSSIFFGNRITQAHQSAVSRKVKISRIITSSTYSHQHGHWKTLVNLELQNRSNNALEAYEAKFTLPTGCWISNYYLNIGNRREYGILSEKKAAMWVFNNIKNQNKDPGILYYLSGNTVALKVFPFAANENRKTGLEVIHKGAIILNIDGYKFQVGAKSTGNRPEKKLLNGIYYIPVQDKKKLKLVKRLPQYHFIIDLSNRQTTYKENYYTRVQTFIKNRQIKPEDVKLHFVNSISEEMDYHPNWKNALQTKKCQGGFYLEGAIKKILIKHYRRHERTFPVIITVTNDFESSILPDDYAAYKLSYPDCSNFYELDSTFKIWKHSLMAQPQNKLEVVSSFQNNGVRLYEPKPGKVFYLKNDNEPSICLDKAMYNLNSTMKHVSEWDKALLIEGMWIDHSLNRSPTQKDHLQMVKQSIASIVLSPNTAYLVVENEAQKIALKRKQQEILSGNKDLDPDEDTQRMDEPNFYLLLVLVVSLFCIYIYKKRNKITDAKADFQS